MTMDRILVFKGDIGKTISLVLEEDDGSPINLTSATVTAKMYTAGSDELQWSYECVVDDATNGLAHYDTVAGDFSDAGMFYTHVVMVYENADQKTVTGPAIEVTDGEENAITIEEFLDFIGIPSENAKSENIIKMYLEHAEAFVNLTVVYSANIATTDFVKLKKTLIIYKAAINYFMNLDEQYGDPNQRLAKIKHWQEAFDKMFTGYLNTLTTSADSPSPMRRVKHTDYASDSGSYLAED